MKKSVTYQRHLSHASHPGTPEAGIVSAGVCLRVCLCVYLSAFASLSLLGPTCVPDVHYQDLSPILGPDLRPNRVFH